MKKSHFARGGKSSNRGQGPKDSRGRHPKGSIGGKSAEARSSPPEPDTLDIEGEYLWDAKLSRLVDRKSTEYFGIPEIVLMESAGRGVAEVAQEMMAEDTGVIVLAGKGNNGADALVAARTLANLGNQVFIFGLETEAPLHKQQKFILDRMGLKIRPYRKGAIHALAQELEGPILIIDGVLGLGCHRPIAKDSDEWALLEEAKEIPEKSVLAVDLPSGMLVDLGEAQEIPLPADITVTFGGKKPALVLAPSRDLAGEVVPYDIGFPYLAVEMATKEAATRWVIADGHALILSDPWKKLAKSSHKFDRGHVLIIGGSPGKTGAPLLAAMASLRMGAGWASVAMPRRVEAELAGDIPRELTFEKLFSGPEGDQLSPSLTADFIRQRKVKALVIGPGMMASVVTPELLSELAQLSEETGLKVVFDAGACDGLISHLRQCEGYPYLWVATPHPGEWQKMGLSPSLTPGRAEGVLELQKLASDLGCSLLYKNATPVFIAGDSHFPAFVSTHGTNSLARAGSGDLLAGIIAAHAAIGLQTPRATLRSLVALAYACELAAKKKGHHAVLARDILDHLGQVDLMLAEDLED